LPLKFSLSLAKLPPGRYNCQISVVNPAGAEGGILAGADYAGAVEGAGERTGQRVGHTL